VLKVLSRITEPTEGYAEIHGRVGSLLEVGTGFHPELTGRENIYLNGAILGMKRAEIDRKFDEIVDFSGVEKFMDTPVKRYSSGMYVRLAFAVAAHLEPEILLVDEVLAVGDAEFQKKCLGKMGDVAKEGRTVLFVSHNMQAIRQLCRRAVRLADGRLVMDGLSDAVVHDYLQDLPKAETLQEIARLIPQLPPHPAFRLRSVVILQDGHPGSDVVNGRPVELEVVYEVLREVFGLHVYFRLYDSDGNLLFESLHNGDSDEIPTMVPGTYVSHAVIPSDFLSPIMYELRVHASIAYIGDCFPEPLSIRLNVQAAGRVNRAYPGYRTPGKLAPLIEWHTERLMNS
jgi:lipopolysaccharide transport system ATP-binding protein